MYASMMQFGDLSGDGKAKAKMVRVRAAFTAAVKAVKYLFFLGVRYARTVKATSAFDPPEDPLLFHPTTHHRNPEVFRLIDEFLAAEPKDHDLVFYLWGHSFELDRGEEFNSWAHMERVLKALSGKPDVNYVTNMEFIERR